MRYKKRFTETTEWPGLFLHTFRKFPLGVDKDGVEIKRDPNVSDTEYLNTIQKIKSMGYPILKKPRIDAVIIGPINDEQIKNLAKDLGVE